MDLPLLAAALAAVLLLYVAASLRLRFRPPPPGVHGPGPRTFAVPAERVRFLADRTWRENGSVRADLSISDHVVRTIRAADEAVLDVFLLDLRGRRGKSTRHDMSALVAAVRAGGARMFVLSDPVNTQYGTAANPPFDWLDEVGATVVQVDLERLPHNNLLFAPAYEVLKHLLPRRRFLPDPTGQSKRVSPYAIAKAITARADHRKLLIARGPEGVTAIVASANLSECSAYYDNVGVEIRDDRVAALLLESERATAEACGATIPWSLEPEERAPEAGDHIEVTALLGPNLKPAVLRDLGEAARGDEVVIGMLFLSDRDCIGALVAAQRRGAAVTLVLDANQKSFSTNVGGFPNRVVVHELRRRAPGVEVRWHGSDGEYHSKFLLFRSRGRRVAYVGSANLTRRSLLGTNLETSVRLQMQPGCRVAAELDRYAREVLSDRSSKPATAPRVPWTWRLAYRLGERLGVINC